MKQNNESGQLSLFTDLERRATESEKKATRGSQHGIHRSTESNTHGKTSTSLNKPRIGIGSGGQPRDTGRLSGRHRIDDPTVSTDGKRDRIPSSIGELAGHFTDAESQRPLQRTFERDPSIPKQAEQPRVGNSNYDLTLKPKLELTPAKRRDINNQAISLLDKPPSDLTEPDKDILRQYSGVGGLNAADSVDAGSGVFNQYYTDYDTIKEMYRALSQAGITPRRALEPSVGSGNFIGMYPNASWTAVDTDPVNVEVTRRLYPEADVSAESYETFNGKGFDLIISNVPFASYSALPREHANEIRPAFKSIHNFFFAHSVDKLEENGVMAFMTSTGTMDGGKEAGRLREHLIKEMDVLGAFRLPMGSQSANATTEVMADIIYLQKRPEGVPSTQEDKNNAFVELGSIHGHSINQFYIDHPECVLGNLEVGSDRTRMGREGLIVTGQAAYSRMQIERNDYSAVSKDKELESAFADRREAQKYAESRDLMFYDGSLPHYKEGFVFNELISFKEETGSALLGHKAQGIYAEKLAFLEEIEGTLNPNLIEAYRERFESAPQLDKELQNWAQENHAREILNSSLALFDKEFNPSEIFTAQVRFRDSGNIEVDADSPLDIRAEALECIDGFVTSEALSNDEVQSLLAEGLYARVNGETIQNARLYYAGNIYDQLDKLDHVEPLEQREKQRALLEAVKPTIIPIARISITGTEKWLQHSAKEAIGSQGDLYGTEAIKDPDHLKLYNNHVNSEPLITKSKDDTPEEHAANLKKAQQIFTTEVLPQIKQKLIDSGLSGETESAYNQARNFFAPPVFDGSSLRDVPQRFRGENFRLMSHQQEGIERAIYNKRGVIAHAPGLGKTPAAIITADQLMKRGVMNKPLFIVPANTITQWENTARELYPDSKIFEFPKYRVGVNKGKAKEWQALTPEDKEQMVYNLANNRYDYTFISSTLAQKFTVPAASLSKFVDQIVESTNAMDDLDDSELSKKQIKAKERRLAKIAMLKTTMMTSLRDDERHGFSMEKLGFDAIFADEVQYYKNIGMTNGETNGDIGAPVTLNAKYPKNEFNEPDYNADPLSVSLGSARSYDFRFKTQYISENNNNNNVFLLTGTPTPNKPLELITLLHHLDPNILDEYGITNAGDFINEFFEIASVEDVGIDGSKKAKQRLVGIKNIDILKRIITRYVDYRSPESAKDLKRPRQKDVVHSILKNDAADDVFTDIQGRLLKAIEDAKAMRQGEASVDAEAIIQMYTAGRDASIDVRLYTPTNKSTEFSVGDYFEDETREEYSKIAKTVSLVAEQHSKDPDAGQIIFLDRLKFANDQGSTHADIRDKIILASGLDPEQVIYVNGGEHINPATGLVVKSGPKQERLETIKDAYNSGKIKVIIGNTSKLGVGMDLQTNTTDIYQIDKPYRPDEVEQRNNRGVRQGNRYEEVTIHTFSQVGTFDDLSDRILANKRGFNDVFWKDQEAANVVVDTPNIPDAYTAAIALEQDPIKRRKIEIERDLVQASGKSKDLTQQINTLSKRIKATETTLAETNDLISETKNKPIPNYKNKAPQERIEAIAAFKKRQTEQSKNREEKKQVIISSIKELIADKERRENEFLVHEKHIKEVTKKFVIGNVVSLDAIAAVYHEDTTNSKEENLSVLDMLKKPNQGSWLDAEASKPREPGRKR